FIVILKEQRGLQEIINLLGDTSVESVVFILSTILNLSPHRTRKALSKKGLLSLSGLLRIDRSMGYAVYDKLDLLDGLSESLQESEGTIDSLLSGYFTLVSPSVLTEENYLYEKNYFTMIKDHLQRACERQDKGVNILVYGPPGTGKTEFAKVVSENIGCKLYEVKIEDDDEPFDNQKRLRAFQLVQQILSRRKNAIILFDEIDSLLSESFSFFRDGNSLNLKSWINKNLENSLVPAIWIANNIDFSESAFIRRFDIVFHLGHPPRSTRLEIMNNYFHGIPIDRKWMVLLADNKYIVPAVIARAANVIRSQSLKNSEEVEKRLEKLLESTQTAMGYPWKPVDKTRTKITYQLDAVNSSHDLKKIVHGLKSQGEGRLCLYGPPGTGKTEFGYYLAQQLDKPLLIRRGSDLLTPFVGETEVNIAKMFYEATYEKAVLLLDEADSFLRDRNKAQRIWEVTQVNELLTQMEGFTGVFVCSTNLMDSLDVASLRRFDVKIKFDFLKIEQSWNLFQAIFRDKGIKLSNKRYWREELKRQQLLTPGDFATVVRKNQINGVDLSPEGILAGLTEEMVFKNAKSRRSIGFFESSYDVYHAN
ncbi:MAG: ATP-binding protein, partial [Bacteroidales bacterium]|nr:ATP-binding protein [Bacteroidales bacterium]